LLNKKVDTPGENGELLRVKLDSTGLFDEKIDLLKILDLPALQSMMDNFFAVTGIANALIDLNGKVLVGAGWQDICTKFHRNNPQTLKNCLESDLVLTGGVKQGEFRTYKCKNNLWDTVTPLFIGRKHLANIFLGQFLFEEDNAIKDAFAAQAEKYGFDKAEYFAALEQVPRADLKKIQKLMSYLTKITEMISTLGLSNLKLAKSLSDQKKGEHLIRESEQRWATTLSSISDAVIATDITGKVTFMNTVAEQLTGWTLSEAANKPIQTVFDIINEQTQLEVENPVNKVLEKGTVIGLANHTILIQKNGKKVTIDDSAAPIKAKDGTIIGVVLVFRDITERKKMEQDVSNSLEESKQSESEISALLKASRAVLQNKVFPDSARAIFDACKELIGATAGYVALLSDTGNENEVLFLDSGGFPCTVNPSLPMPIRGLRAEAYKSAKVAIENDFPQSQWQKFSPKGHVQLKNVLFAPLIIEQRVVGVIGLANKTGGFTKRDAEMAIAFGELASIALANSKLLAILEKNEKELKLHSEHLETLVEERTKQLKDSERLAAIGATAGMVGHDIRNPLQAITGDLYLAKTELAALPETAQKINALESLEEMEHNIDYINKIVVDLQDYARPLNPKAQETNIKALFNEILAKNGIPKNIKVTFEVKDKAERIMADPDYLKRIASNLTLNAVQAMPEGGQLTIRAYADKQTNDVCITIKDTGVGIPEDIKPKLFTPMMTTKSKGQGFGLAVVKRMTEGLGGTVSLESQEGKGTTFIVRLPQRSKR